MNNILPNIERDIELAKWARDKAIPVLKNYASLPKNGREIYLGNGQTAMGLPLGYCPWEAKEALEALPEENNADSNS